MQSRDLYHLTVDVAVPSIGLAVEKNEAFFQRSLVMGSQGTGWPRTTAVKGSSLYCSRHQKRQGTVPADLGNTCIV